MEKGGFRKGEIACVSFLRKQLWGKSRSERRDGCGRGESARLIEEESRTHQSRLAHLHTLSMSSFDMLNPSL